MHKRPEDSSSALAEIHEFAINWTIFKMVSESDHALGHLIWKHPLKLRVISQNSSTFLSFYLDYLTECSKSLKNELEDNEMKWMPGSVYLFIYKIIHLLFESLPMWKQYVSRKQNLRKLIF